MVSKTAGLDQVSAAVLKQGRRVKLIIINAPTTKVSKKNSKKFTKSGFDYWATLSKKSMGRNNGKN